MYSLSKRGSSLGHIFLPQTFIKIGLVALNIDMASERIGMMLICFITYDLYKYTSEIESKGIRSLVRLLLLLLFSLPTLFFESSRQFLM